MTTSPGIARIIEEAKERGFIIQELPHGSGVNINKTRRGVGITIWADGTATRNDVDLHLTMTIRTHKAMRRILGL